MQEGGKINKTLILIVLIIVLVLGLLFLTIWAFNKQVDDKQENNQAEIVTNYPSGFNLKDDEVPQGFQLEKMSGSKMNRIGLKTNPGFIHSSEFVRYIYSGINPNRVDKVYTQRFQKGESDDNLGILAVKYNSVDAFQKEEKKIDPEGTGRKIYLKKGDVLTIVWCDKYEDIGSINKVSNTLADRLGLENIN